MLKIVLIRPGTTEFDLQGRILGTLDVPLCDEGNCEVEGAVDQLRGHDMQAIYSSPSESAQQTAETIAETLGIKYKVVDQLQNIDHGLWQGKTVEEVRRKQPKVFRKWQEQPGTVCPPQGEMLAAATERLRAVLAKIIKKHKTGAIGIVVPEPLNGLAGCLLRQEDLNGLLKTTGDAGSWEIIDIEPAVLTKT